jgi:2-methylaconitate cis-trans-isomerase PrpF
MEAIMADSTLIRVPVTVMRGGTSRGLFFKVDDLPGPGAERDEIICSAFGSGSAQQTDGLGGADILTSKVAIVGPSADPRFDVDYTFGQVGIADTAIDYGSNCGNISSAVGVFAVQEGWVPAKEPETVVRVNNTNTGDLLVIRVPVRDGIAEVDGDFTISGVPGTGAEIRLDFRDTAGSLTGRLLPTGSPTDMLEVPELGGQVAASIVDVGKAAVFADASDLGLRGTEHPSEIGQEVLQRFAALQRAAALAAGLDPALGLPRPVAVAAAQPFTDLSGRPYAAADASLVARIVILPPPYLHKAYSGTGAVALGAAARLPGTVPYRLNSDPEAPIVRIGHPSGVFPVRINFEGANLDEASFSRTARRLFDGYVAVRVR